MACFHHSIKSGKKGTARRHANYIDRAGTHSDCDDLIHTGYGNLPDWANDEPLYFWRMADCYERANGAAYREHEIALPNELTIEQLIELSERLVRGLVGNKPYQYAIHGPEGKLGGIPNPHIHLMYSDRVSDGIDRTPDRVFARFNPTHPAAGGCRKDSGGRTPIELRRQAIATRELSAGLQNEALAMHGHTTRVDHRSLRDQGLQRRPEHHLGPRFIKGMTAGEKTQYAECRTAMN